MFLRNRCLFLFNKNSLSNCKQILQTKSPAISLSCNFKRFSHNAVTKSIVAEKEVKAVNKFVKRTHTCGELSASEVGEKVQICGWLQFQRMGKFLILRDAYGLTQCIIPEDRKDLWSAVKNVSYESVLSVVGTVVLRPDGQQQKKMSTGEIEVVVESLDVDSPSCEKLPFNIRDFLKPTELTGLKHRYLFLRFPEMQTNLRLRSWVINKMRDYLINHCDFIEVETPTLFRRTPGGAHEFVVPTRYPNKFYSLTQSPQQLKQLLMVGGIDRYFQVARCYRDETSRNDRQPEFTQMDIELSFTDREGVMELTESLVRNSWPEHLGDLETSFPRMTYEQAMEQYGSENPDLTIPYRIKNVTNIMHNATDLLQKSGVRCDDTFRSYAVVIPGEMKYLTKSLQTKLANIAKRNYKEAKLIQLKLTEESALKKMKDMFSEVVQKNIIEELNLKVNDVLFLTYGKQKATQGLIGKVLVEFTNTMESEGHIVRSPDFKFVWIYDFPLFELKEDDQTLVSAHHPFTKPHNDDMKHLSTDPTKVRGLQYDLVLNGSEIAGGSIRIHESNLQHKVLQLLNIHSSDLDYFLKALNYGAPPHGGIALGLDRYISMLCRTLSIRDVIAFPKTIEGNCMMTGAPTAITKEEQLMYHLKSNVKN